MTQAVLESKILERKQIPFIFPVDICKQTEEDGQFFVRGYASTTDLDLQGDVILPEALKDAATDLVSNSTVLLNHDIKRPIGKVTDVQWDGHGLLVTVLVSKSEPEVIQKIKEGILNKFSVRGSILEREKKFLPEYDRVVNVIKKLSLVEVSLVSVPANPEAKAIEWFIRKALDDFDNQQGGDFMSKKDTAEETVPNPSQETDKPQPKNANPPRAETPSEEKPEAISPEVPEKVAGQTEKNPKKKKDEETAKASIVAQLEPVWLMLDRLMAMGGEVGPIVYQVKSLLKQIVGDTTPMAAPMPSAMPMPMMEPAKSANPEEMAQMISAEVKKQLDTLVKGWPTLRKGLVPPETEREELSKEWQSAPPEQKLKAALALHYQ